MKQILLLAIFLISFSSPTYAQDPTIEVLTDPIYDGIEVRELAQDSDGNIWIAAQTILMYDGIEFTHIDDIPCISCVTTSIATGDNGTVWIGESNEIYRLNNGTWETMTPFPFQGGGVSDIIIDQNEVTWFAIYGFGLLSYDGNNWTTYEETDEGTLLDDINALAVDHDNHLWLGLDDEIIEYDGTSWNVTENIPSLDIPGLWGLQANEIKVGPDGIIWVIVSDGLIYFDGSIWRIAEFDGVPTDATMFPYALDIDHDGQAWMFANTGNVIFQYSQGSSGSFFQAPSFDIRGSEIFVDSENRIWVGGIGDSLVILTKPPVNSSEEMGTVEKQVVFSAMPNPAKKFINLNFEIPHSSEVNIEVYNLSGKKVSEFNEFFLSGEHTFFVNTNSYHSGMYLAKLISSSGHRSIKFFVTDD